MKKFFAFILTICIALPCVCINTFAEEKQQNYSFEPTNGTKVSAATDTAFLLKTAEELSVENVNAMTVSDPSITLSVTQRSNKEFLIKPDSLLKYNTVYMFCLVGSDGKEMKWAVQTAKAFNVQSVLPANQSTNIPVNSGIEITFSETGYKNFESNFKIEPKATGRFEYHDKAAVFVPNALEYETVYGNNRNGSSA